MATQLPAKLKTLPDIARFAQRAAQLEKIKPAVAYWCEYWIINQLIARGLHNADAECLSYTTRLMDKLEATKSKFANDDAIVDDTAGQAYVEQFGLETFDRAERAVEASRVSKQTADTFLAASTFLELLHIWGEPDGETQSKIRYAKWNAVRIVKAIKEGKDPNESNPAPEPVQQPDAPLDPNDPEVQKLNGDTPSYPPPPSVQEVLDDDEKLSSRLADQSDLKLPPVPSAQPFDQPRRTADSPQPSAPSPAPGPDDMDTRGYPPSPPTFAPASPPISTQPSAPLAPTDFPTQPSTAPPSKPSAGRPAESPSTSTPDMNLAKPAQPTAYDRFDAPDNRPGPSRPPAQGARPQEPQRVELDDAVIAQAQKHAKWAISALNFEDSVTAVRELKAALQTLGE